MRADVDALIEDGIALRFLPAHVDRAALAVPLKRIFEQGKVAAVEELVTRSRQRGHGMGVATRRAQFTTISRELNQVFFEFPLCGARLYWPEAGPSHARTPPAHSGRRGVLPSDATAGCMLERAVKRTVAMHPRLTRI